MNKKRPYVLSIAGYDASAGAGVLADVKTFESIGVYGVAVTTCITYQNDNKFAGVHWLSKKKIKNQLYPILEAYKIEYVKIGLIENLGKVLFTEYALPFEISSVLFLSAMVGAVVLGKKE